MPQIKGNLSPYWDCFIVPLELKLNKICMYLINVRLVFICSYFLLLKSLISRVIHVEVNSDYSALYLMLVKRESSITKW